MEPYQPIPREYQLNDKGIDPRHELFSVPRKNEILDVSLGCFSYLRTALGCVGLPFIWCCMLKKVKPMHDTIVTRCGIVTEILREPGPYCLNPCCMDTFDIYMGLSEMELTNLPINDSHGNPL